VFFGHANGKPLGILLFIWLGVRIRWVRIPPELSPRMLVGGALLGGIGFTMSLLIAAIAFEPALLDNAKRGILYASLFAAVTGTLVLRWRSTSPRTAEEPGE
jgi:NhaA family Na+:H+ antiporter